MAMIAGLFSAGGALAACWVSAGSEDCCTVRTTDCTDGTYGWQCVAIPDAGPFTVQVVTLAGSGAAGSVHLQSSPAGGCKRDNFKCGDLPNECINLGQQAIDCVTMLLAPGHPCSGGSS
ncbi:MAG: hypothetical protein HBSAPP03_19030 [Phycisphaerae bacterium]|nr:MAG: hypothetical protein HBSAPP03_19030 [Phycisphaerae bacterium]